MEQLWAPWRIKYIEMPKEDGCILCQKPREPDDETSLILYRGQSNFVILNTFPYNPGHLMVAPYRHTARLQDLTDDEAREHLDIVRRCLALLEETLKPSGFNVGLNLGKVAGAGIEKHIHTHIVPRWQGDTNFMPVLSDTKVISEELAATYKKLKAAMI
jgi:Diadenosine tetraphosphate (Ap4A) hydrolase and other HIT family hydrolases